MKLTLQQACIEHRKGIFKCRRTPYNMSNHVSMYWGEKKKWSDAWHEQVLAAVIESKHKKTFEKASVTIVLHKHRLFDKDGAYNSIKPILDGLRYAKVIKDDSEKHINLEVKQIKVAHKKDEKVEIEIVEIKN